MRPFHFIFILMVICCSCGESGKTNDSKTKNNETHEKPTSKEQVKKDSNKSKTTANSDKNDSEESDCVFDTAAQDDSFIENVEEFANYTWNDKTKTATILLNNGDTIYAQRGGCIHINVSGKWVRNSDGHSYKDVNYWLQEAKWLCKRVYDSSEYKTYLEMIENDQYKITEKEEELNLYFTGDHYKNHWYFRVKPRNKGETIVLKTGHYFG